MRHKLSALFLSAFLAMSIVACDDILLPDDPWDPGNGGGGDTTENPVDTNRNSDTIILSGIIQRLDATSPELPPGAKIIVVWHRADGQDVIFGEGNIIDDQRWSVLLTDPLPSGTYWSSPTGQEVWGVGSILLVDGATPSSGTFTGIPLGATNGIDVIFDTNKEAADGWGEKFLGMFPGGYMAGMADMTSSDSTPIYRPMPPHGIVITRWQ